LAKQEFAILITMMKTFALILSITFFWINVTKSQDLIKLNPVISSDEVVASLRGEQGFKSLEASHEILPILFDGSWNMEFMGCIWKPNFAEALEFGVSPGTLLSTTIDTVFSFGSSPDQLDLSSNQAMIVAVTKVMDDSDDCHGCSVALSLIGLEFVSSLQSYQVVYFNKFTGRFGAWGELGEVSVIQIGNQDYCLKVVDGFSNMGHTIENVFLFLNGNRLLSYTSYESNGAAVPDESQVFEYNTAMSVDIDKGEIVLSKTGSELVQYQAEKFRVKPVNEKVTYKLTDGEFEKVCN